MVKSNGWSCRDTWVWFSAPTTDDTQPLVTRVPEEHPLRPLWALDTWGAHTGKQGHQHTHKYFYRQEQPLCYPKGGRRAPPGTPHPIRTQMDTVPWSCPHCSPGHKGGDPKATEDGQESTARASALRFPPGRSYHTDYSNDWPAGLRVVTSVSTVAGIMASGECQALTRLLGKREAVTSKCFRMWVNTGYGLRSRRDLTGV